MANKKWNEENIKEVAMSCDCRTDFYKRCPGGYVFLMKHSMLHLLDEWFPRRKNSKITSTYLVNNVFSKVGK